MQPDWWEATQAGVGTDRYGYSFGDPVNKFDPDGNEVGGATPEEKAMEEDEIAMADYLADASTSLDKRVDTYLELEKKEPKQQSRV